MNPKEYKVIALRECPVAECSCDTPDRAADYWRQHITSHPYFNPDVECMVALMLNARQRIKGHYLISTGLLDSSLVHSREVFRAAIVAAAHSIVLMHNHPSGDPSPSEADIKVTRDLLKAGRLLKIDLVDHVIIGRDSFQSLRGLGYF